MFSITRTPDFYIVEFSHEITLTTLLGALHDLMARPDYTSTDVWILDRPIYLGFSDFDMIIKEIQRTYPAGATRRKTALVANSGYNQALADLWVRGSWNLPYESRVFTNLEKAREWICEHPDVICTRRASAQ